MSVEAPVSVVIVSRQRPRLLARVLDALAFQRYRNFEIIVVSDTDPARRPPAPWGTRWISFDVANISAARNLGLSAARGEIVAFCDDDAVPEFSWLEALMAPFSDPDVGAAGGYVRGRNGVSFQWQTVMTGRDGMQAGPQTTDLATRVLRFAPDAPAVLSTLGTNCAFRRSALAEVGGFDAAFAFFLDETDLNFRLSQAGWATAIVPDAQVLHGHAAGPHRSDRRVPNSLLQIGASTSYFTQKYLTKPARSAALERFRAEQRRRLDRLFLLGLLSAKRCTALLAELDVGIAEGASRSPKTVHLTVAKQPPFSPVETVNSGRRHMLIANVARRSAVRDQARQAVSEGDEVSILYPEPTPRRIWVDYEPGYGFRHRFGLFALPRAAQGANLAYGPGRITAERARIVPLRGPFEGSKVVV